MELYNPSMSVLNAHTDGLINMHGDLNSRQKQAVETLDGPLLILAGAGAGKTKTVTHRIINLIEHGVAPHQILAITFTNKAAKEMRERVMGLIEQHPTLNLPISTTERPFVSTFHSLGVHILKTHGAHIGLSRYFNIMDRGDSKRIIKESLESRGLDPKEHDPGSILNIISREKGDFVTLSKYMNKTKSIFEEIVAETWKYYEAALQKENSLDFDDLLVKTAALLETNEEVRQYYWKVWTYIHIDEYQDTNKVQYAIAKVLAEANRNICAVGDIDQTIYSWRGADIRNIMNFEKDYPETKTILLEENYRSTKTILKAANGVIRKNVFRKEKNLFTNNIEGDKIRLNIMYNEDEEARMVADTISALIKKEGVEPREVAVLYRANFQSRVIEDAMLRKGIPYQILGTKFFERKEVKDVISYIRAALNRQSTSDLIRTINTPPRGIGKVTVGKLINGEVETLSSAVRAKIDGYYALLDEIARLAKTVPPSEVVKYVIKMSGLELYYRSEGAEGAERIENVKEIVSLATKYDNLESVVEPGEEAKVSPLVGMEHLLSDAALASDQDDMEETSNATRLMTVHSSKGLEFDYVFIVGMEEDLFPYTRFGDESKQGAEAEEERRLFYVALTRARKRIYLSSAQIRTIFGSSKVNSLSKFIADIDESLVETIEQSEEETPRGIKAIFIDF